MNALTWIHVAGGAAALLAGTAAIVLRKGGGWHRAAGTGFVAAMAVLGITASLLAPFADPVQSPVGGVLVLYFVGTGWFAARRHGAAPGLFEKAACAFALALGAAIVWEGVQRSLAPAGTYTQPPPPGALIAFGSVCLLAGLGDLRYLLRGTLTQRQRIARHLWRMCIAFFIATGSFFLGQMDVLPAPLRNLPLLLVLAFAPFAVMLYALVRNRVSGYPLPRKRLGAALAAPAAPEKPAAPATAVAIGSGEPR